MGRLPHVAKPVITPATDSREKYKEKRHTIPQAMVVPAKQGRLTAQGLKPQFRGHIPDPQFPLAWAISFT